MSTTSTTTAATTTTKSSNVPAGLVSLIPSTTTSGATTTAAGTASTTNSQTEYQTIKDMGLPDFFITWFQGQRSALGLKPFQGSTLFLVLIVLLVLVMTLIYSMMGFLQTGVNILLGGFTGQLKKPLHIILFVFGIAALVTLILYYSYLKPKFDAGTYSLAAEKNAFLASMGISEGFQTVTAPSTPPETTFLNLQPLAVKQTAYIGSEKGKEDGGFFHVQETESGIQNALKMGIRAFTLQIDYLDGKKDPAKFDAPGVPTLLYRNDAGVLISDNGASIQSVAKQFATFAFNPDFRASSQPLILYLHVLRAPNGAQAPEEYLKFMSRIAEGLEPLFKHHLNTTPDGNFQRQGLERQLLTMPMKQLEGKVVILSNADTSLFRSTSALGIPAFEQKYDLDYLVNLRVYARNTSDRGVGIATPTTENQTPSALVVPLNEILSMSTKERDVFARSGKARYVIAMPSQLGNPKKQEIEEALESAGVNWVPLNLFEPAVETLQAKLALWKGSPMNKSKPLLFQMGSVPPTGA